jgi:hypothetical protein
MKDSGFSWAPLNIDSAVGFGGANRSDDVMLVQYLLRLWGGKHYGAWGRSATGQARHPLLNGLGPMLESFLPAVDGNCDGVTKTWIMMFQMCQKATLLTIDGRVDPIPNQPNPRTNTMLLLNRLMWNQGYSDLPADAPAPLIQAARTVR